MNRRQFLTIFGKGIVGVAAFAASPMTAVKILGAAPAIAAERMETVVPGYPSWASRIKWWWRGLFHGQDSINESVPDGPTPGTGDLPAIFDDLAKNDNYGLGYTAEEAARAGKIALDRHLDMLNHGTNDGFHGSLNELIMDCQIKCLPPNEMRTILLHVEQL